MQEEEEGRGRRDEVDEPVEADEAEGGEGDGYEGDVEEWLEVVATDGRAAEGKTHCGNCGCGVCCAAGVEGGREGGREGMREVVWRGWLGLRKVLCICGQDVSHELRVPPSPPSPGQGKSQRLIKDSKVSHCNRAGPGGRPSKLCVQTAICLDAPEN